MSSRTKQRRPGSPRADGTNPRATAAAEASEHADRERRRALAETAAATLAASSGRPASAFFDAAMSAVDAGADSLAAVMNAVLDGEPNLEPADPRAAVNDARQALVAARARTRVEDPQ